MLKRMRVKPPHWSVLLDYLEEHPELAREKVKGEDKQKSTELWEEIASKLNSLVLGKKSPEKWKNALTDWKCKVKSKLVDIRMHLKVNVNNNEALNTLNQQELRLMSIIGWSVYESNIQESEFEEGKLTYDDNSWSEISPNDETTNPGGIYQRPDSSNVKLEPEEMMSEAAEPTDEPQTKRRKHSEFFDMYTDYEPNDNDNETLFVLNRINENIQMISNKQDKITDAINAQTNALERIAVALEKIVDK